MAPVAAKRGAVNSAAKDDDEGKDGDDESGE